MYFKINWTSLILGKKFTVFLCFTLYLRAISKYKPPGGGGGERGLIFGGAILRRVFCIMSFGGLYLEGLIFGILRYLLELEKKIIYLFVGIFSLAIIGVKVLSLQKLLCVS